MVITEEARRFGGMGVRHGHGRIYGSGTALCFRHCGYVGRAVLQAGGSPLRAVLLPRRRVFAGWSYWRLKRCR